MIKEIFIKEFKENFNHVREQPIALYGIGQYTEIIVNNLLDYNFVGLMDSKTVGDTIYGLKVLDDSEVIETAKIIIIVSNLSVSEIIYNRIRHLEKIDGIEIYFLNGLKPSHYDESISENNYWNINVNDLKLQIEKNDVISFDIFDTLIMRKCLKPKIIFDVLEEYLLKEKKIQCNFKEKRMEAEKICYRTITKYFDFDLIYKQLKLLLGFQDELINELKVKELQLEYDYVISRSVMVDIFNYAKKIGKKVILTSDMYLNSTLLIPMLEKCNIFNYDNLFISCERNKDKYNGHIWNEVKELYTSKKILHIGDNSYVDVELPQKYGIHTFKIMSTIELYNMSGISNIVSKPKNIDDYLILGAFASKIFNDPFGLSKNKGKIEIQNMFDFGYLFFGPIVLKYILWLMKKVKEEKIDIVLFPSRDGYVLEKIYSDIISKFKFKMPKGLYFLTSRRAASVASVKTEEDIIFIVKNMCNIASTKVKDILYNAFGLKEESNNDFLEKTIYEIGKEKIISYIVSNYKDKILENAKEEREGYLNYISKLELNKYNNIGFVNFVGRGVTQKFVTNLIEKELKGLYFATEIDILEYYDSIDNIFACYGNCLLTHTSKLNLLSKYLFGEIIFSSPDEQLLKFDIFGKPVFLEKTDRNFLGIKESHNGIRKYIEDIIDLINWKKLNFEKLIEDEKFSDIEFIDDIFGIAFTKYCKMSKNVKNDLKFYDPYKDKNSAVLLN